MLRTKLICCVLLVSGCVDTGRNYASIPLFTAGTDLSSPISTSDGSTLQIDRADIAFGPLYLCAGASAGQLCETARFEWLESAVIDTTLTEQTQIGTLDGVTGPVRSWMYELGISSQLTRLDPFVLDAAQQLGGFSFVLEATATVSGIEIPVTAELAIQQSNDTELGVPVIRKSVSEPFFRDITGDEDGLLITFDASKWVTDLPLEENVTFEVCTSSSAEIICDGLVERSCDGATEKSNRNCRDLGQVCLPGLGCQEKLDLSSNGKTSRNIRNALLSGPRPSFSWTTSPSTGR